MKNDKYISLAHEQAVLTAIIRMAKEKFLPMEGADEPEVPIESEHLPRSESLVPEDTVIDVIMKLQRLATDRETEMQKFNFVKTESSYESAWQERPEKAGNQKPPAPGGQGKGKSRKGGGQAPGPASR